MNIVVLDGGTTNPGDLSWGPLEQLGNLTVYDETPAHLVKERLKGAQAVILNRIVLGREEFSSLPELRYVGTLATGYNTIDTHAAGEFGITVCKRHEVRDREKTSLSLRNGAMCNNKSSFGKICKEVIMAGDELNRGEYKRGNVGKISQPFSEESEQ